MIRPRRATPPLAVELTPLLDVVFLLLTFFVFALVVSSRLLASPLELPGPSSAGGEAAPPSLIIELDAQGALTIDGEPQPWDTLADTLTPRLAALDGEHPTVAVDINAPTGDLFKLMDALQDLGTTDIQFLRKGDNDATPAPPAEGGGAR